MASKEFLKGFQGKPLMMKNDQDPTVCRAHTGEVGMSAQAFANHVSYTLRAHANPMRAKQMSAYMRNRFVFFGIPAPTRRRLIGPNIDFTPTPQTLLQAAKILWSKPEHEHRYVACDMLQQHHCYFQLRHLPAIKRLLIDDPWWDTVDSLTPTIGAIVKREAQSARTLSHPMDPWIKSKNFWLQRSAMLHQLGWKSNTDKATLRKYALSLSHEPEFFIRKAIGWALRDYARTNPAWVQRFVEQNQAHLSPLSCKEATKRL